MGAYGRSLSAPLVLHVIPDGTSDLHFLAIDNNSQLYDVAPPFALAQVVPRGFLPTAAAVRHKL